MTRQIFSWPHTDPVPPLAANGVHVWAWDLDRSPLESEWNVLSETEILRARRFVFPRDRDRYVRAHSAMRSLLSGYSGIGADRVVFSINTYGKPQIERFGAAGPIHFNLTHSAGVAALAVSRSYRMGIDIEQIRPVDAEVAEHHFSSRELLTLRSLTPEQWLPGFFRCWTSKEALLKGEGLGLNLPLDGFDVEVHPQRPAVLIAVAPHARIASGWSLAELSPAETFVGTLAIHDPAGTFERTSLQCFSLRD